jgi:hypothetical protein
LVGTRRRFNREVLEPRFKPVHWLMSAGVPIGYSLTDLLRLADLGREWLELAGVERHDVLVSVLAPDASVAYWQLVGGARRARVSALHHGPTLTARDVTRLAPSVLAGSTDALVTLLSELRRQGGTPAAYLRTVLAVGDGRGGARVELARLASPATVVEAWCAPGARAVWTECREASGTGLGAGFHTWARTEVVEPSEWGLLWTGVGWSGSALLRVRTGVAGSTVDDRCPRCGRPGVRVVPDAPGWVLGADPDVLTWFLEPRPHGAVVFVALRAGVDAAAVVRRLDAHLGALQYVVVGAREIEARLEAAGFRSELSPA